MSDKNRSVSGPVTPKALSILAQGCRFGLPWEFVKKMFPERRIPAQAGVSSGPLPLDLQNQFTERFFGSAMAGV